MGRSLKNLIVYLSGIGVFLFSVLYESARGVVFAAAFIGIIFISRLIGMTRKERKILDIDKRARLSLRSSVGILGLSVILLLGGCCLVSVWEEEWIQTAYRIEGAIYRLSRQISGTADEAVSDGMISRGNNYRTGTVQLELGTMDKPTESIYLRGFSGGDFNLNVTERYGAGDYLYYFGGIDDAWLGLWGIIRVYRRYRKHLKPLCRGKAMIHPLPPCPSKEDVVRRYEVVAVQKKLIYNRYGDHDPDGLVFVPLEDVDDVLTGKCMPKPLILRANAGDWIEVTLHNAWDPKHPIPYFSYPRVPLDKEYTPSMRVSLNPQFLRYDPVSDSGINVGYNEVEQTVGVGESKRYLWHADREYGACIIQSFGDMRNHRYHGLFGSVIVEPPGAEWYRNFSRKKDCFAEQAVITAPGTENFREYVLFIQNGIRLLDAEGNLIQTAAEDNGEPVDAEDTGEKGYNYASERFANRFAEDPRTWKVFSSKVHGDPATPVWKAYPGDRVVFRVMMPADKPRNTSIAIHDQLWREQRQDPFSRIIPLQGGVSIGNKFDIELQDGAGCPGDYLYRSGSFA